MSIRKSAPGLETSACNKSQRNSYSTSPGGSATIMEEDYESFMSKVRSPLQSPLSLPLLVLLNDCNEEEIRLPEKLQDLYKKDKEVLQDAQKESAGHFRKALEDWDGKNQTSFRDILLLENLKKFWEETSLLKPKEAACDRQESVPIKTTAQTYTTGVSRNLEGEGREKMDILLSERSAKDPTKDHPLCGMEIGIKGKCDWWAKLCQGVRCLAATRNSTNNGGQNHQGIDLYHFDKQHPMLLCSISVDKDENKNVSGDFGILLCVPARSCDKSGEYYDDFRYILLWRKRIDNDLAEVAAAFGKVTMASFALYKWRKEENEQSVYGDFRCLGPNCARFGNRLYRSYDNRVRATERSPSLYLEEVKAAGSKKNDSGEEQQDERHPKGGEEGAAVDESKKRDEGVPLYGFHWYPSDGEQGTHEAAKVVLELSDGGGALQFGELLPDVFQSGEKHPREWFWENRGKLLIISVPFRSGGHQATEMSDFRPIFDHLVHLHKHDMVHGDIRAFNMVFGNNQGSQKKGWLIDLDFGGRAGVKKLPQGFVSDLGDGQRLGRGGELVTKSHDYHALWQTIDLYFTPSDYISKVSSEEWQGYSLAMQELREYFFEDVTDRSPEEAKQKLEALLKDHQRAPLRPRKNFQSALKKLKPSPPNNNKDQNHESPNKAVATGSLL